MTSNILVPILVLVALVAVVFLVTKVFKQS